ncbi:MAG: hypothetical protein M3444_01660 [Acidobacteriota bacterium]|nr:hypothetical protein [Acidobacteriota bacterium]
MGEINTIDIIISIADYLRRHQTGLTPFLVIYEKVEEECRLPADSVQKYIWDAALQAGLYVIHAGATRASLREYH